MTTPKSNFLIVFLFFVAMCWGPSVELILAAKTYRAEYQQNQTEKKALLNGRIFYNKYTGAVGDQFFLSNTFLKGSVVFNGRKYDDLDLQFDILNDEVLLRIESYPIIIMNKEMVDSFSLVYGNSKYLVYNAGNDTSGILKGYVNILYGGRTSLYAKYSKKIQPLGVDGRYDLFVEAHSIYMKKGNEILPVNSKKKFLDLLEDRKKDIRHYIKSNRVKISYKNPDSFIPVLMFYDSLTH